MRFEARNYAMGGMRSGPELALCQEAVYGADADMISWDFGMTDAGKDQNKVLFANRIGVHQNKPATMYIRIEQYDSTYLEEVEANGLTAFYMEPKVISNMQKPLPDMFGMTQEEMDAVPEYVRHYKCQNKIEKGDPTCEDLKYNEAVCKDRMHKAPWHPGWRVNAVYGNLLAFWLIESLKEALQDLGDVDDPKSKLEALQALEENDHEKFETSTFPEDTIDQLMPDEAVIQGDVKPSLVHRGRAICHTALLPAETRFKGILTETKTHVGFKHYTKGISKEEADKNESEGDMRIVIEKDERQDWCPVTLKMDFKDCFYTNSQDHTTSLTFPNEREVEEYGEGFEPKGILIVCFVLCDWGECPDGELQYEEFKKNQFKLTVNDQMVTELVPLDLCAIMKNKDGYNWEADDNGQYEVKASVKNTRDDDTPSYIRITSLILM